MKCNFPDLQTPRLKLRELTENDVDVLFAIHSNPDSVQFGGTELMLQPDDARKLIADFAKMRQQPSTGIRWGICTHESTTLLGTCGFQKWNREWNSCLIRYELKPEARGQGYMHEALRCALVWAFANMHLNRVGAQIHPGNRRAIMVVEKLGFAREGLLRKAGYWDEQYHDLYKFGLLKSEFYG